MKQVYTTPELEVELFDTVVMDLNNVSVGTLSQPKFTVEVNDDDIFGVSAQDA